MKIGLKPKKNIARPQRKLKCLTAYVMINNVPALALFDSKSLIDVVSPDYAMEAKLEMFILDTPIPLQLRCVGSH